jgi:hypothetical protein
MLINGIGFGIFTSLSKNIERSQKDNLPKKVLMSLIINCKNFTQLGDMLIVYIFFIWNCVSGLMQFRDGSDSECASNFVQISGKNATENLSTIRQVFGEESVSRSPKVQTRQDQKLRDR